MLESSHRRERPGALPPRTRKFIALAFSLATIAAIAWAVSVSLDPDQYYFHDPEARAGWRHPSASVAIVSGVMLLEAMAACLAIISPRPAALWLRCFLALLLLGPWALVSTLFVVHAPGYILIRHLWVWLLVLTLVVTGTGSALRQLWLRVTTRAGDAMRMRD